jgi:signal peptidase I
MTSKEAESNSSEPADDRWAEIVAVTGYDDDPAVPIYTGRREPPLEPQRRLPESALFDLQPGPAARPHLPPLEAGPSGAPPLDGPPTAAWEEDDVVLRAFEEHARSEPAFPRPVAAAAPFAPPEDGIDELLGSDADAIVEEAMSSLIEGSTAERDPARQPMPWEDPPPPPPVEPESQGWEQPPAYDDDALEGDEPLYSAAAAPFPGSIPPADVVPATVLKARKPRGRTVARELVETLLLALLVFLAVRASFQNFKVDGNSMYPTLENGEFLIVNKLVYSEVDVDKLSKFLPFLDAGGQPRRYVFHGPERGDIIVLQDPRDPSVDLIKRVIGLPGETVEIVNGVVFVNGLMLEEPYITQPWHYTGPPVTLGPEEYFVMGDNRDNSKDSRSVGPIPKELIIGKAMLTYWPASHFGLAPNEAPKVTDTTIQAYREEHGLAAFAR